MTPQELKKSILKLAMQGRITEQLKSDGDASDILPFLHIDKKIDANEEPFDIPDNWLWIPVGNLGASADTDSFCDGPFGSNLKTVHYIDRPEVRIIQLSNIGDNGWKDKNVKYTSFQHLEEIIPRCEVHPGDFVIAKMMPAGRTIEVPNLGTRITLGSDSLKFVPNSILNKKYLLYAMNSAAFLEQVYAEAHGITRVRTTLKGVKRYVLPIPPLEEQKRIVAKIEELLPLIDKYEKAWTKLEEFNKKFPDDMQKSILQMAIQGKLVEQRAEEGTAEELYQQIQEEKQRLIKEKKIKKQKALPEITEDEIPFDIPDSWKWVRWGNLSDSIQYGYNASAKETGRIKMVRISDIHDNNVAWDTVPFCEIDEEEIPKYLLRDHDILFARTGGTVGKSFLVKNVPEESVYAGYLIRTQYNNLLVPEYLKFFMESELYWMQLREGTIATAQPNCNGQTLSKMILPLPPLEEQKRIVEKIEQLLPLCEKLK